MLLYWDAVLNHKAGADKTEKVMVREVDQTGAFIVEIFLTTSLTHPQTPPKSLATTMKSKLG